MRYLFSLTIICIFHYPLVLMNHSETRKNKIKLASSPLFLVITHDKKEKNLKKNISRKKKKHRSKKLQTIKEKIEKEVITSTDIQKTTAPAMIKGQAPPSYPYEAKLREEEGQTIARVWILENGKVESIKIIQSSGYKSLDNAVIKQLKKNRFTPGTREGKKIASKLDLSFNFKIQ